MKTIWVIVQTFDNCDPQVSFGGTSEREAVKWMETLKAGWGEWEWDHCTECVVKELSLDGHGSFRAKAKGYRDDDVLVSKMPESKFR